MSGKLLQQIRELFRRKSRGVTYEPVTHRLDPSPILPQGMMEAIAPAYEEALAKEKEVDHLQEEDDSSRSVNSSRI